MISIPCEDCSQPCIKDDCPITTLHPGALAGTFRNDRSTVVREDCGFNEEKTFRAGMREIVSQRDLILA
jgi:hypothetical protein